MRKAAVVLPTYNERENIEKLVMAIFHETRKLKNWQIDIIVVDSQSPDGTGDVVKRLKSSHSNLHLITTKKEGLGRAYLNGFSYALNELKAYVIFEMDADFSHDPNEITKFLKKIEGGADFVVGSRYIPGGSIPKDWRIERKIFSVLGNLIIRFGFMKLKITDWTSGFRAIKGWVLREAMPFLKNYSGYVFQVALLDFAVKKGARIEEIPINFIDRKWGKSKINSFQYIVQTLLYVLFFSPFIRFVIVGLIGFLVDFGVSYFLIERLSLAVWLATAISTETAVVSNFLLNNFWSFSYKKLDFDNLKFILSFIKFNIISSGSILIQTIGVQLSVFIFGREFWILAKVLIIAFLIIPYSYFFYNKMIWRENR